MDAPVAFPQRAEDLDADWFSSVLARDVSSATVTNHTSGTTGRARVALRGGPDVPASVFVKLAPADDEQRALVERTGMGVAEARFYRDLAPEIPVRIPGVWFADTDGSRYVMVLEDLVASGCRIPSPNDPDIETRARDIVDQLAMLHAPFWDSHRFRHGADLQWLAERGERGGGGGRSFIRRAVDAIGDELDDSFYRIASLYLEHAPEIVRMLRDGTWTLVHGDDHLSNLFVDVRGGDRTGFLDWAVVCAAPGIRDVSYVLCGSVPVETRERIERELVDRYCTLLIEQGVNVDPAAEWDRYRLFAIYAWVSATSTAGMGSKWHPISVGLSATARATRACTHLGTVELIESLLV